MLQFINLFFIPVVSVYIWERHKEDGFKPSLRLFMLYACMAVVVIALSHTAMAVIYRLFEMEISDAEPEYTLLALIVAYLIPYLYRIIRARVQLSFQKK